jgi:hypothetical protein
MDLTTFGLPHDMKQDERCQLERKVLSVLKEHGPLVSGGLHFLFDPNHTADIEPVFQSLRAQRHIEVTEDMMFTITDSGFKRLEEEEN